MGNHEVVGQCRLCGGNLEQIIDFGSQVIANHFHSPEEPDGEKMPLRLVKCGDCSLVQLGDKIDTDLMYRNYWYQSGINATMHNHLAILAGQICSVIPPQPGDVVLDIGCNDGTLLGFFPGFVRKIGVDPSNIASTGCERITDYFNKNSVGKALHGQRAKIITSIAMFYDLNDPKSFVRDIRDCLCDDGVWIAELSYLPRMLENVAYDSVCHEHVAYYRMETFLRTLEDTDLEVFHAEVNDMNGSSFRAFVAPRGRGRTPSVSFMEIMDAERAAQLESEAPYTRFVQRTKDSAGQLVSMLAGAKSSGELVYGYGASTKGQVILQYCGIAPGDIRAIAERNPRKYGLLTPGTNIPICSEAEMRQAEPDMLVIFPWYFLSEFVSREQALRSKGCKLVVPLPEAKVV